MKRSIFVVLLLLLISSFLFACASKKVKPESLEEFAGINKSYVEQGSLSASEYMPLNLGNTWVYRRDMLGEKGTLKVSIDKKQDGFFIDSQGGVFKLDSIGLRDPKRYLLQNPIHKGQEWKAQIRFNLAEHFVVVDDNAVVDLPAGTFKQCVVVKSRTQIKKGKYMVNRITYAPGIGMVRTETWLENEKQQRAQQVLLELESYIIP